MKFLKNHKLSNSIKPKINLPNNYSVKKRLWIVGIITLFALLSFVAMLLVIFLVKKNL